MLANKLNPYLTPNYDTGQSYRKMEWVARASTLGMVVAILLNIGLIRPFKGVLVALQFHHKAGQGQQVHDHTTDKS